MTPPEMDEDDSAPVYEGSGLLGWIVIPLIVLACIFAAWAVVSFDTLDEKRIDAERRYEELRDLPIPTKTVTTPGPVRTKIVTTPGPTRTIYVTERASRSSIRESRTKPASGIGNNATLACIRKHESGNDYRDVSDSGTYRGAYQMSRQYSPGWAKRAGYGQWAGKTADQWPPAVQDAVAWDMSNNGRWWGPWKDHTSYDCPGF
jgi:hypothetical protein